MIEPLKFPNMLPSDVKYDPQVLAQLKADTFNKSSGSLAGYDCPKCQNRGGFLIPREDGSVAYQECSCMKLRRCLQKMTDSGLGDIIRDKTFEAFQAESPWQQAIKEGAEHYAKAPTGWFLICGQSGSGKTHLCTAICRELLLAGKEVLYMPWRDELPRLRTFSLPELREAKMQEWKNADILYIDDFFKTGAGADGQNRPGSTDINVAFELINYRYIGKLPTLISTELTTEKLLNLDEALAGRILEMARGSTYTIKKDPSRNYRLQSIREV